MRSSILFLTSSLTIASLCGCGGSGGGSGSGPGTPTNPYAGTYSGTFEDSAATNGPFTMQVSSSGAITGQFSYAAGAEPFSGTMSSAGTGSLTVTGQSGTFQITVGSAGKNVLSGGIGTTTNGWFFTSITNPNGQFGGSDPFAGEFAGTVHNTTLGKTGIICLVAASSGAVDGVELIDDNGVATLSAFTGTLSSAGALSYKLVSTGVTVSGTASVASGAISAPLTETNGDAATLSLSQAQ